MLLKRKRSLSGFKKPASVFPDNKNLIASKKERLTMKELVGQCVQCQKELFCLAGFFQGQVTENGLTYCFVCYETLKKESDIKPNS
jgi:hypothetical protein